MKTMATILIISLLAGCAGSGANYVPVVDRPGPDFHVDLKECQEHAEREMGAAGAGAVGAVLGALVGAAVGRGSGYSGSLTRFGAGAGAAGFAGQADLNQRTIIVRCMAGRGYSVLR